MARLVAPVMVVVAAVAVVCGSSGRHANGKRKREATEGQQRQQHQPKAKNSLQAALYGGRRGGGLGSSKNQKTFKKRSKR